MSHIKNFYEDIEFELWKVPELIEDVCHARLKNITEKLDGQNFTFTVNSDFMGEEVRFLGKGVAKSLAERGGLGRAAIQLKYYNKPDVSKAFLSAYDTIQNLVEQIDQQKVFDTFRDGKVAVSAEILLPENSNIVHYSKQSVRFIDQQSLDRFPPSLKAFDEFVSLSEQLSEAVGAVPILKQKPRLYRGNMTFQLQREWQQLLESVGMPYPSLRDGIPFNSDQMDDLRSILVFESLKKMNLGPAWNGRLIMMKAATRLANGNKKVLVKKDFVDVNEWKRFQAFEADRSIIVNEALVPLEEFFRNLATYALSTVTFALSEADHPGHVKSTVNRVNEIKQALKQGRIKADPKVLRRIESAANRCPHPELYTNVEGIVFKWGGNQQKLVGYYGPINSLLSFFRYGQNPATII